MMITKKDRIAIYSYLFQEGVIVVKKAPAKASHDNIPVRNLFVMKLMRSMTSKKFVRESYNWRWLYYTLTDEGVEYLRTYLGIAEDVIPATHKPLAQRAEAAEGLEGGRGGRGGFGRGRGGGRGGDGYRRGGGGFGRGGARE